jgi:transposase
VGRRGASRATIATAHAILVSAHHMLSRNVPYDELGDDYFHRRERDRADRYTRRLVRQLKRLGQPLALQPAAEAT